jgi:hypothetical protein
MNFDGWEFCRNRLMRQGRFSPQLGKTPCQIKKLGRLLIPPFPGSNPGAPAKKINDLAGWGVGLEGMGYCAATTREFLA